MRLILLIVLLLLGSCQSKAPTAKTIDMYNASGDMVGTAKLNEAPDGVNIKLKLEGIAPGFHGIHVHEYPKCEGPDFKSAGNHFNPEGKEHGHMNTLGAHLGDLPNIDADESGLVDVELMLADTTLLEGKKSLLRKEGTSLIITEEIDDGLTQPAGNSGARIICGEIKMKPTKKETESPTDPTEVNKEEEES